MFVIIDQIDLNTIFYVVFAFMVSEYTIDYQWTLQELKKIYEKLELSNSTVIITNCERALVNVISLEFPTVGHIFCTWHINNNVWINCKKQFETKKAWETFFSARQSVMFASSLEELISTWNHMNETYDVIHSDCMDYPNETYIRRYKTRFVRFYINKKWHFGTTVTSREEGAHAVLKRSLVLSTGDLKIVVDSLDLQLKNQRYDYLIAFEAKMRFPMKLKIDIFRDIQSFVTSIALRMIFKEFKRLTIQPTALSACINGFTTSIDLSCSHWIQARMFIDEGCYFIEDVHPYWRFEKPPIVPVVVNLENPPNPLLHVIEPEVVRTRGRRADAENQR
jgi:hypothetical protein